MGLRFAHAVVRLRLVVLAVALVATGGATAAALRVPMAHSIEMWLLEDDADLATARELGARFGSDDSLVVALESHDALAPRSLAALATLARGFEQLPGVRRTLGLPEVLGTDEDGTFDRAAMAARFADRPTLDPFEPARGTLLDRTGRVGAVVVELAGTPGEGSRGLLETVRRRCDAAATTLGGRCRVSGTAVIDDAFVSLSRRDVMLLGPAVALVVLLVLLALVRHRWGVLALVATATASVTWAMGLMSLLGIRFHLLTLTAPPLLLAIGIAEAVHLVTEHAAEARRPGEPRAAVARAAAAVLVPCVFTTITTACGYASLLGSRLAPVRELGVVCVAGSACTLLATFTVLPALLAVLPSPRTHGGWIDRAGPLLGALGGAAARRPALVLGALAALLALSAVGIARLRVRASDLDNFPATHRALVDTARIDRELGGALALDVLVEATPGAARDPEVLRRLERIERRLSRLPGVGTVESLPRALRFGRAALLGGPPALPADATEAGALLEDLALLAPGFERLVTPDGGAMHLRARFSYASFGDLDVPALRAGLARDLAGRPDLRARPTGLLVLLRNVEGYLLDSQLQSAGLALLLVLLAMGVLLRSPRLALLAMIPNVAPLIAVLGIMGALGIPLDVATTMIVSIGLGIAVDDTIHVLDRWRRVRGREGSDHDAAARVLRRVGPAVTTTSLVLVSGSLVLVLGSFRPDVRFGALTALTVALAFVCDVLVTPAVLALAGARPVAHAPSEQEAAADHEPRVGPEQRERVVGGE